MHNPQREKEPGMKSGKTRYKRRRLHSSSRVMHTGNVNWEACQTQCPECLSGADHLGSLCPAPTKTILPEGKQVSAQTTLLAQFMHSEPLISTGNAP